MTNIEQTPTRRRAYSPKFKLDVVRFAEQHNNNMASKEFKVDRNQIRDWREKKENYQKQLDEGKRLNNWPGRIAWSKVDPHLSGGPAVKRRRLGVGGRKLKFKDLEEVLADWIRDQRDKKFPVLRKMILMKAAELNHNFEIGRASCRERV